MVDIGVALAWVAISAVSLKGLSAFGRAQASLCPETDAGLLAGDGALAHEDLYPLELSPLPVGGPR